MSQSILLAPTYKALVRGIRSGARLVWLGETSEIYQVSVYGAPVLIGSRLALDELADVGKPSLPLDAYGPRCPSSPTLLKAGRPSNLQIARGRA